jgi:iron complex outermembrane receptor protein
MIHYKTTLRNNTMRKTILALNIGALAVLGTTSTQAQEKSGFALEEVVVTAQKRVESAQDIPISVQAFSSGAIDKLGANNLSDLSEAAPSLIIGGLGKGSQQLMGMRGVTDFARNVGIDARMGVYIDGVYQGRSYTADVPLLGLESVELLRGPQGTLFGKNTETGAISLNTKKPSEDFEAELGAEYGRYEMGKITGYVNGGITDTLFASASGSYQQGDGYFDNIFLNEDVGDWDTTAGRVQLRWLPSDMFDIRLSGDYAEKHSDQPLGTNADLEPYKTQQTFVTKDDSKNWGTALTADVFLDGDYTLTSISAFRHNEFETSADDDYTPLDLVTVNFNEDSDQYSQELRLASPVEEKYDWVGGLYYFYNDLSSDRTIDIGEALIAGREPSLAPYAQAVAGYAGVPAKLTTETWAAYVHGNYRFTPEIELTAGIRYTSESKDLDEWSQTNYQNDPAVAAALEAATGVPFTQFPGVLFGAIDYDKLSRSLDDDDWSPTVGLNYFLEEDIMLYAKYSRGFKSGGWNVDYMTAGLDYLSYKPESVDSYEFGLKSTLLDDSLRLNATYYYSEYDDFQVLQLVFNDVNSPTVQYTNAAAVTNQGVELESTWIPTDSLQFTLNAAWLDTNYDDFINQDGADYGGNELPYSPEWKIYTGVQYIQPVGSFGDLTFNVDYAYTDQQYTDPNNVEPYIVDSYGLWNARVTLTPVSEAWEVSLWGKNLGDKEYMQTRSLNLLRSERQTWGSPQMYGISAKYFFGG